MLDKQDLQAIKELIDGSDLERVRALEEEISLLKAVISLLALDMAELKKAQ